jgi:hypothetical protein
MIASKRISLLLFEKGCQMKTMKKKPAFLMDKEDRAEMAKGKKPSAAEERREAKASKKGK